MCALTVMRGIICRYMRVRGILTMDKDLIVGLLHLSVVSPLGDDTEGCLSGAWKVTTLLPRRSSTKGRIPCHSQNFPENDKRRAPQSCFRDTLWQTLYCAPHNSLLTGGPGLHRDSR